VALENGEGAKGTIKEEDYCGRMENPLIITERKRAR